MKFRTILAVAFVGVASAFAQNTLNLQRTYRVGEKDSYRMNMVMTGMNMTVNTRFTQTVRKVFPNGDAEIVVSTTPPQILMNGKPMSQNPNQRPPAVPDQVIRLDRWGRPVGQTAGAMGGSFNPAQMANVLPKRPLRVGETFRVNEKGKNGETVTGTVKVVSVANGIGTMQMNMSVRAQGAQQPMAVQMTAKINARTAKPQSMTGTVRNLPGMPNAVMNFTMTKV